jgi:hypothetical protein
MIEIDDDVLHCLSASARKRLRDDSQMGRLLMEIVDRAGALTAYEAIAVYVELEATYGSAAAAIVALKTGDAEVYTVEMKEGTQ